MVNPKEIQQRPFKGELLRPAAGFLPLPDDVLDEFRTLDRGPCYAGKFYYLLQTNQVGEIQIHPCNCGAIFIYSETYGWLVTARGSMINQRIEDLGKMVAECRTDAEFDTRPPNQRGN